MMSIFLVAFVLITGVEGLYEGIDDITNNLATDLAPLITLFGEQVTKQFLSESTSFTDSIIFSIAPLGLITAVVSVIRIYGSSSFKSIIGRSQEAHGMAEAELCSSTSQDVCELWSNGGICRVFGRPKILDFIYNTKFKNDFYPKYRKDQRQDIVEQGPSCGICRPSTLFLTKDEEMRKKMGLFGWEEVSSNRETNDEPFANPNLTLNIGMRTLGKFQNGFHWSVLIFSVILQLSFFIYAAWATFYNPSFASEGNPSPQAKLWFVLTILGTIMLVFGMILCARLIDLKSCERKFKRTEGASKIFWLQPGGQRIGDQLFHAFAYSENRDEYITSGRVDNTERGRMLLLAVISTTLGWVLQFVGLRGSPGSIALFQFIATLIMSFLRAILRGKRLEANHNRLGQDAYTRKNLIEGHELDWQAMNIDEDGQHYEWRVGNHFLNVDQDNVKKDSHHGVDVIASKHFRAYYTTNRDHITHAANYASEWVAAEEAINPDSPLLVASKETQSALTSQSQQNETLCINPAAKIMRFRWRLAELTDVQFGLPPEQAWDGESRTTALQLQTALQVSAEYIFAQFPLDQAWNASSTPKAIAWKSSCSFLRLPDGASQEQHQSGAGPEGADDHFTVGFQMYNRDGKWSISIHQLEAVLGLWSWTLKRSELLDPTAEEQLIRSKMVVVEKSRRKEIEASLYLWVTQTRQVREHGAVSDISRPDNLSIPTSSLLSRAQSSKLSSGAPRQIHTPVMDEFTILSLPTNGSTSLLHLMAQDVYTVFINRIVDITGNLCGTGSPKDYLKMRENSLSIASQATPLLELTNIHIDALANALVSAGIATREEALMSIVPAFLHQKKLPLLDEDMVQNLLDWAKSLRRELKFREGAALITWMLSGCPSTFHKQGLRCLGDLYRRAALSKKRGSPLKKRDDQEFGLSGMCHMKKRHSVLDTDGQNHDILSCYEHLYHFFHDEKTPKAPYDRSKASQYIRTEAMRIRESEETAAKAAIGQEDLEWALTLDERFDLFSVTGSRDNRDLLSILTWAIVNNLPEVIEDVWTNAPPPNDQFTLLPLGIALKHECELETFHSLLDWPGIDLNSAFALGEYGRTPLVCAIEANRADVVCSILRRGAYLHQRDIKGMTPLHHALQKGNEAMIRLLLDKGAPILRADNRDQSALHFAAKANGEAVVRWLLEEGAHIHEEENHGRKKVNGIHVEDDCGRTALHVAAGSNHEAVVRLLLEKGADMHAKDDYGQTALHVAAETNGEAVVRFLLQNGADLHQKDELGQTPLHSAARAGNKVVIPVLLASGAEIHEKDEKGRTSLHLSAAGRNDEELTQLLLEKGANIHVEDGDGQTALHAAAQSSRPKVLKLLLEKSAENELVGNYGWSSLWSVIREGDEKIAQLLEANGIKKPLDIEREGEEGGKEEK